MKIYETILFAINRYFVSALRILKGLILAKILGPYLLGIFGFIMLVQMYIRLSIFGLSLAINFELATNNMDKSSEEKISDAFTMVLLSSLLILIISFTISYLQFPIFSKFEFNSFLIPTVTAAIMLVLSEFFTNIHQVYNKLGRIGVSEIISILPQFILFFMFEGEELITFSLYMMTLTGVIS